MQQSQSPSKANNSSPFRIFSNAKYSLYFGGQLVSQIGTWMQQVALSWFSYTLTQSPFILTVVGVSSQLPSLIVMPFAGVIADRFDRHKILVITQFLAMIQAAVLAYLTLTHQVQVWQLILLGLFAGTISAFDMPTRSAFVVDLVNDRKDLPNAIAMNSTMMNITRLIGPALAGFIIAAYGEGMCFLGNAISYVVVIGALLCIKGDFKPHRAIESDGILAELKDGLGYTMRTGPVRDLILLMAFFGLGGMSYALLLPVFVQQIGGDANTMGYLMAASAAGSLVATMWLASRTSILGLGKIITTSSFVFALGLFSLSLCHNFWFAAAALALIGACMMLQIGSISTILQSIVEEDKRGRVMSFFTLAFMGSAPLGSLLAGAITSQFGFQVAITASSIYCLLVAIAFLTQVPRLRKETKPIYIQRGIMIAEEEVDALTA